MKKPFKILMFLVMTAIFNVSFADGVQGLWLTQKPEKNAKINIAPCENDKEKLCGTIVWLEAPTYEDGSPKTDKNNEDEGLRNRPIMNLLILEDFVRSSDTQWIDGNIYNPEDGKTYSCTITLINEDGKEYLDVRGYVGLELFGKTQRWIKVSK
jgi:uncharacterized protein (DUF2147 family)